MKKLFLQLTQPESLRKWWYDVVLMLPRIYAGYLLTSNFGSSKFGLPWSPPEKNLHFFEVAFWFPTDIAAHGGIFALAPAFWAWMAAFSEAVGGLAWIIGVQIRLFSFLIAITMLVAAFVQHAGHDLWQKLPALGFLWIALYSLVLGAGRFSIDYLTIKLCKNV